MDSALNNFAAEEAPASTVTVPCFVRALFDLAKPKIAVASVITALAAYVSTAENTSLSASLTLLLAAGLAAGGSLAFNQWWERDSDLLMQRTHSRPLPQKIISPSLALTYSIVLSATGCLLLWGKFGFLTAALGVTTVVIYAGFYTPMKSRSCWATEVGSISGALPPLIGAAAANNIAAPSAWLLAATLFFWQMPHFYAIGWIHRNDYRAARLPLLPATDPDGQRTGTWAVGYAALLSLFLLISWHLKLTPDLGGAVALTASLWILIRSWKFRAAPGDKTPAARRLFRATLLALPTILLLVL